MNQKNADIQVERVYPEHFQIIEEAIKYIDSPSLLGYHTPAYMNCLTKVLADNPLYLVAYSNDKIAGFLPLRWRSGSLGPVINGLPFFGPNGGPIFTRNETIESGTILKCIVYSTYRTRRGFRCSFSCIFIPHFLLILPR